jgi:DNA-binding NarL/FixJ family response regulator
VKILVCDDHPLLMRGLADLIAAEADMDVVAMCADGEKALKALADHSPDLAILDISMPGLGGIEVFERSRDQGWSGRAILLTASISDDEVVHAIAAGIGGIVLKEVATTKLVEAIRVVASGGRWMQQDVVRAAVSRARKQPPPSPMDELTARERDVAALVADGRSNRDVAHALGTSEGTVKSHLHNVFEKLGVDNRTAIAILVARERSRNASSPRR